jgi:ABC-type nitrate/sulfonate/bicarbonate transport system permease component
LWFKQEFSLNLVATLFRVSVGFLLAMVVGIPVGILAGAFPRIGAFLSPLIIFGRNIPVAALVPLMIFIVQTDVLFGRGENRKIGFIFLACVAFVLADTARAILDVAERYVDTAFTLGASRWQTIMKVLVPLAMPTVFSSCRLMFGIAFGYIMLAESTREPDTYGGVGFQINIFQRLGNREQIYLILLIIPLVALIIDQTLFWIQRSLFPYQYPSGGVINRLLRGTLHTWDDLKRRVFGTPAAAQGFLNRLAAAPVGPAVAQTDASQPAEPKP